MELSFILKCIDALGIKNTRVQTLINTIDYIIYDTIDEKFFKYFKYLKPVTTLKLCEKTFVDFDFICDTLKPKSIKHDSEKAFCNLFDILCEGGYCDVVAYFLDCETPKYDINHLLEIAVSNNQIDVTKLLLKYGAKSVDDYIVNIICQEGYYELLLLLYQYKVFQFTEKSMVHSVIRGHQKIVEFLHQQCDIKISKTAIEKAIYTNNIDILEYFLNYCKLNTYMLITALKSKNSEMIDYIYKHELNCSPHIFDYNEAFLYTISTDNLTMFKQFLYFESISDETIKTCYLYCCEYDYLHYAKELINRMVDTTELLFHSVTNNSLTITEYLVKRFNYTQVDKKAIKWCVKHGYISMLNLCINIYDSFDFSRYIFTAVKHKQYDMVEYILDYPIKQKYVTKSMKLAIKTNDTLMMTILYNSGNVRKISNKSMMNLIKNGIVEYIKLLSIHCSITDEMIESSIEFGQMSVFQLLVNLKSDNNYQSFLETAIRHGQIDITKFIVSKYDVDLKTAIECGLQYQQYDIVKHLLDKF